MAFVLSARINTVHVCQMAANDRSLVQNVQTRPNILAVRSPLPQTLARPVYNSQFAPFSPFGHARQISGCMVREGIHTIK